MTDSFPKFDLATLFPSLKFITLDQIQFTVDLFVALGSYDMLKEAVARIIIKQLYIIEMAVKLALKLLIRDNISCNIDPTVMGKLKSEGIKIHIDEWDLLQLMRINPTTAVGQMFYFGFLNHPPTATDLPKSKDLNAFLYSVVHNAGSQSWPQYSPATPPETDPNIPSNIATFEFDEGPTSIPGFGSWSNVLTMKVGSGYQKLHDFNSDFIDSVVFFDRQALAMTLMGRIFGTLSLSVGVGISRTREEILVEDQINDIIDRLSRCVTTTSEVDDSFFSFDNQTYNAMLINAEHKKHGRFEFSADDNFTVGVSTEDIAKALEGLSQTSNLEQQTDIFIHAIDDLTALTMDKNPRISETDKFHFKVNILKELIVQLSAVFSSLLVAPKIYLLILINLKLLGVDAKYTALEFLKQNLNLVIGILNAVKDAILDELLRIIYDLARDLAAKITKQIAIDQMLKIRRIIEGLIPDVCSFF
jgi:hypothetical protein